MTRHEKNQKGIFTEQQIELAYKFYTKEHKDKIAFWLFVNQFWNIDLI